MNKVLEEWNIEHGVSYGRDSWWYTTIKPEAKFSSWKHIMEFVCHRNHRAPNEDDELISTADRMLQRRAAVVVDKMSTARIQ